MRLRIALSYCSRRDDVDYAAYPDALKRVGVTLGLDVQTTWLATHDDAPSAGCLKDFDAIVFTGGPDVAPERYGRPELHDLCKIDERRDAVEWALAEEAASEQLPTLGICRGMQLLNVVNGGSLIADVPNKRKHHDPTPGVDARHSVRIEPGTVIAEAAGLDREANSSHHQAIDGLAPDFRATAWADDGIVEAYEWSDPAGKPFFLAVQWHPERIPGQPLGDAVIAAFLNAVKQRSFPVEHSTLSS